MSVPSVSFAGTPWTTCSGPPLFLWLTAVCQLLQGNEESVNLFFSSSGEAGVVSSPYMPGGFVPEHKVFIDRCGNKEVTFVSSTCTSGPALKVSFPPLSFPHCLSVVII